MRPPAISVIGDVVRLREELNWHETKPLFGTAVACAVEGEPPAAHWTWPLTAGGSEVVPVRLLPRLLSGPLAETFVQSLATYHWLVFADRRQVEFFFQLLQRHRCDIRRLRVRFAVLGEETAAGLAQRGVQPDHVLSPGLSPASIRRRLADPDERICFLKYGYRSMLHQGKDTFLSLGRLAWDETHPSSALLKTYRFDACAAADPYHLEGLAELAGEGWQDMPLYCLDNETARWAQEMGWKPTVIGAEGGVFPSAAEPLTRIN